MPGKQERMRDLDKDGKGQTGIHMHMTLFGINRENKQKQDDKES